MKPEMPEEESQVAILHQAKAGSYCFLEDKVPSTNPERLLLDDDDVLVDPIVIPVIPSDPDIPDILVSEFEVVLPCLYLTLLRLVLDLLSVVVSAVAVSFILIMCSPLGP